MKQGIFTVTENIKLCDNIYKMTLKGDASAVSGPGQFIEIKLDGLFLRRPISVCDYDGDSIVIIYKTVGHGTEQMSLMKCGETLDVLTGLGNGYDTTKSGNLPLLIGGGAGVPPLYALCKKLIAEGKKPSVILGFNKAEEVFYEDEFKALGAEVYLCTADGSAGIKGFVTDAMKSINYTYFYACGPEAMFKAIEKAVRTGGEYSLEERMGCGFGACMGCSCNTRSGPKRVCKDGPVFEREEIIW